jgi:4-amino-4-deoxy-L-arabinose transferase-like glycosyltransferase
MSLLGKSYPPRYPFGFSALLAPAYWLPHATLATGIYAVVVFGAAGVVLTYAVARLVSGRVAGVAAAVTMLLLPGLLDWSHEIMSETADMMFVAAAMLCVFFLVETRRERIRRALLAALGLIGGMALLVHTASITLPLASFCALVSDRRARQLLARSGLLFALGPALALVALALYDRATFGGVTRTGYQFWVPEWYTSYSTTFAPRYALVAPGFAGDSGAPPGIPNLVYYARSLIGFLPDRSLVLLLPTLSPLALLGIVLLARRHNGAARALALFVVLFGIFTVLVFSAYFFQSARFMAPLAPTAALCVGIAIATGWRTLCGGIVRLHATALTFIAITALLTLLSIAVALPPAIAQTYVYQRLVHRVSSPTGDEKALTAAAYAATAPQGSFIVTDVDLPFMDDAGLSHKATIISLSRGEYWNKQVFHDAPVFIEQLATIDRALDRGAPVLTDAFSVYPFPALRQTHLEVWRALAAYDLIPIRTVPTTIYRLRRRSGAGTGVRSP